MDEFAQTGAQQDDLFDDIQYDQSMQTRAPDDLFNDEIQPLPGQQEVATQDQKDEPTAQEKTTTAPEPAPAPVPASQTQTEAPSTSSASSRGRNNRGRGGRGSRGRNNNNNNPEPRPPKSITEPKAPRSNTETSNNAQSEPAITSAEPSQPTKTSVRGDRTATGGLRKPKLSEQELAEKMSRISLKNAALTAAHARAEADAASFAEREEIATKRRQEERRDRQQMMGEREKNRLRKLKAIGGREWDAEKPDDADAFGGPRQQSGRGRGAHGGIAGTRGAEGSSGFNGDREDYTDGREYMYLEDRGRGRGGRGRGGRGGARGGREGANASQHDKQQHQNVPRANDFPDLPAAAATKTTASKSEAGPPPVMAFPTKNKADAVKEAEAVKEVDEIVTPGTEKKSWADMME